MKTFTNNGSNLSFIILEDDAEVTMSDTEVVTPDYRFVCENSSTVTLHESVTPPEDWFNGKYTFDGTTWELNPNLSTGPEV